MCLSTHVKKMFQKLFLTQHVEKSVISENVWADHCVMHADRCLKTCKKKFLGVLPAHCVKNNVISVTGCADHSVLHVERCLYILKYKIGKYRTEKLVF